MSGSVWLFEYRMVVLRPFELPLGEDAVELLSVRALVEAGAPADHGQKRERRGHEPVQADARADRVRIEGTRSRVGVAKESERCVVEERGSRQKSPAPPR